jgi:aspartyl/asparaginyl-tRNA synthetase
MKPDPDRPDLALCVDVLASEGYGEVIGGGQRADDLEYLLKQIQTHGLPEEAFDWYLDLRKYGTFPHAGLAWASSAARHGCVASNTFERRFLFRGCSID